MNEPADAEDTNPKKGGRNKKGNGVGAGKQSSPEVDPQLDPTVHPSNNTNSNPSQERPEVDDIWSY